MLDVLGKDHLLRWNDEDHELDVVLDTDLIHACKQFERDPHAFLDACAVLVENPKHVFRAERLENVFFWHRERDYVFGPHGNGSNLSLPLKSTKQGAVKEKLVHDAVAGKPDAKILVPATGRRRLADIGVDWLRGQETQGCPMRQTIRH